MATLLSRLSRRKTPPVISILSTRHRLSTTASSSSSKLRTEYSFVPPPSLHPQTPSKNTNFPPGPESQTRKSAKPAYRPPSSLDRSEPPIRSGLPFDFRFSYTESSPRVRPIGLRAKVLAFWAGPHGPGMDRGLSPAVYLKVGSVGVDGELEEKRRLMRDPEPLHLPFLHLPAFRLILAILVI